MLKKRAFNRIFITTLIVFITFIMYSLNLIEIQEEQEKQTNKSSACLYTLNKDSYVSMVEVFLEEANTLEEKVKQVLEIMVIDNNKNALLPSYFSPILPKNTRVNDVVLNNDILKIYFSKELNDITKEQSEKMIESITHTLLGFDNVIGIEIYVENDLLKYVPNTKKQLPTVLSKEYGINKTYDLNSNLDIKKIELYYYSKNNDDFYLIPVTKYVNDNREKIEIIIEELSSFIYNDNLISMLSDNVELVNYEISDDKISLDFNKSLYYGFENEVSDEIIKPLLYSIFSNYNIDIVEISVNNNKILEKNKKDIEI